MLRLAVARLRFEVDEAPPRAVFGLCSLDDVGGLLVAVRLDASAAGESLLERAARVDERKPVLTARLADFTANLLAARARLLRRVAQHAESFATPLE